MSAITASIHPCAVNSSQCSKKEISLTNTGNEETIVICRWDDL